MRAHSLHPREGARGLTVGTRARIHPLAAWTSSHAAPTCHGCCHQPPPAAAAGAAAAAAACMGAAVQHAGCRNAPCPGAQAGLQVRGLAAASRARSTVSSLHLPALYSPRLLVQCATPATGLYWPSACAANLPLLGAFVAWKRCYDYMLPFAGRQLLPLRAW